MATLFVEQLTVIDSSLLHALRGLVGETWIVDVELTGRLDDQGMVLDFGKLKPLIKQLIDDHVDHKLLVPADLPELTASLSDNAVDISLSLPDMTEIRYNGPLSSITLVSDREINAESVARHLQAIIHRAMPENVDQVQLTLRCEPEQGAFFHYSHGLRKHEGNCQRIAHGHRSRINVSINNQQQSKLESSWSERWKDIYLADRNDLIEQSDIGGAPHLHFAYTTEQGPFSLVIPAQRCYLLDGETTIEHIAQHVALQVREDNPHAGQIRTRVYEGFQKGAIGIA